MQRGQWSRRIPLVLTAVINGLLLIAVLFLMQHVQRLLYSDVQINLTEVVTQNKNVITGKLDVELNNLQMAADQFAERLRMAGGPQQVDTQQIFAAYCADTNNGEIYVADRSGHAFFGDGSTVDVAGRRYFRLALERNRNISDRIVSRMTGEEIFVMSVPLWYDGAVVGTMQKPYSPQHMYDLCAVPLFSEEGSVFIVNGEGYVMLSAKNDDYEMQADNYFRNLYTQGNREASRQLEEDVAQNRAGFMETVMGGKQLFSAYTPLESIHDWYLISSVESSAVSPNANQVIKLFYSILVVVVLVVAASLFYFQIYRSKQQRALEKVAFHDPIAGGHTFTKFQVELRQTLRASPERDYFLLAFDIDNFKYFNSFYGFDFGDRVLRSISQDVSGRLLPGEVLARISGDHFIALLTSDAPQRLEELLPTLRTVETVAVYLSGGLYAITDPEESVNLMVDKASMAAQSAKGALRKQVVRYTEEFDREMFHNEQLKRQVEHALATGEIIPFFQPKVDIESGALVGAEALARWRTAEGKMIFPSEFIPLCEKTGLITELDMCMFEQTLVFLQRNLAQGVSCVPISVNFSRLHLTVEEFVHHVFGKLKEYGVPSRLIEIELTESVIFDNHAIIGEFIGHLHKHGLSIAMDDFGSGYSSLNMLKDIPIDVLKLDKGFLDGDENEGRKRIILSTIATMAEQLRISVVVEGVETAENVALMREFGYSIAQGYFFARPMDVMQFEPIFREGRI